MNLLHEVQKLLLMDDSYATSETCNVVRVGRALDNTKMISEFSLTHENTTCLSGTTFSDQKREKCKSFPIRIE